MGLAVCYIFIDLHLGIAYAFQLRILGIVEFLFGNDLQFLIQGMGILDLMVHAGAGTIVLHPGLLLEQGAVVQRVCRIVSGSDCDPHGCIYHGHILFELDAVLSEVIVVGV